MAGGIKGLFSKAFGAKPERFDIKQKLKKLIEETILTWNDDEIYAISLFVTNSGDNPCKPYAVLSYNAEYQVESRSEDASSEQEARWNYAYWLQYEDLYFGIDGTEDDVKQWVKSNGWPYYEDDDNVPDDPEIEKITKAFIEMLVEVVKDLHESGIITKHFGRELPILIHEMEYYDEIAEQNIRANGEELVKDFADFCING